MLKQRPLSRWPDAGNVIEQIFGHGLFPLRTVRADGEAVRLVAQALHEIEDGIVRREAEGRFSRHEKALTARVPVRAFGNAHDGQAVKTKFSQHGLGRGQLALAAVDQDKVRPCANVAALGFGVVLASFVRDQAQHRHCRP